MDGTTDQYGNALGSMTKEKINEHLAALPPEQQEQLLSGLYTDYGEANSMAQQQMRMGERMREGAATPQGRTTGGKYGVYTAANPMEHAASAADKVLGTYQQKKGMDAWRESQAQQAQMLRGLSGLRGGINPLEYMP